MGFKIDADRLWGSLMEMGEVGREGQGVNRLALNDANKEGRDLLISYMHEEGLDVSVDRIGNIFALRKGRDSREPPIVMGSHMDTVRNAGVFDGALGVLSSLEVIRFLNQHDIETRRGVAVAAFTNEEGARFQPDMMGSMVFTGQLGIEEAWKAEDDDGVTVKDELKRTGYLGSDEFHAGCFLELHVEQGPVLHSEGLEVGVVEGVQGMAWWDGEYTGEANHAGTTPLNLRRDALLAAADLCCRLRETAEALGHGSVATMGRLHPRPDIRNVVPGGAFFTVDFRQYESQRYEEGQKQVVKLIEEIAEKHRVSLSLEQTVDAKPIRFDTGMVDLVEKKTRELGLTYKRMHSGAGHDAQFMSYICPTAMIFVPSINGRSHCPEERTTKADCVNGANILLQCALELSEKGCRIP
ncbi:MAG: Zn-dependent hydrolase [Candidatus Bathyarchaeota archaeon]|nr:Zn-dependent hydrolase [Candidatus Bathyarchaeota archaeon]